jgi:hypothetical protein
VPSTPQRKNRLVEKGDAATIRFVGASLVPSIGRAATFIMPSACLEQALYRWM